MAFGITDFNAIDAQMKHYLQQQQDLMQGRPAGGEMVPSVSYEHRGGKPTDGKEITVPDVETAVQRLVKQDKHRSLLAAIDTLHVRRQSNGKPVVFIP